MGAVIPPQPLDKHSKEAGALVTYIHIEAGVKNGIAIVG